MEINIVNIVIIAIDELWEKSHCLLQPVSLPENMNSHTVIDIVCQIYAGGHIDSKLLKFTEF